MSIATEITALTTDRDNIRAALAEKGVSASDHGFDDFSTDIGTIPSVVNNQDKTVTQNGTVTADSGYTGLGTVTVNVQGSEIDLSGLGYSAAEISSVNTDFSAIINSGSGIAKDVYANWNPATPLAAEKLFSGKDIFIAPKIDLSQQTSLSVMFIGATVYYIPTYDTSNVTDVSRMFLSAKGLKSIPKLDFSSVTNAEYFIGTSPLYSLTDLGGFTGLSADFMRGCLEKCPNLTVQSLVNVLTELADVTALGERTIKLNSGSLDKLSAEQIAIATNKGWTVVEGN